jgi:hypothetical protein
MLLAVGLLGAVVPWELVMVLRDFLWGQTPPAKSREAVGHADGRSQSAFIKVAEG